MKNTSPLCVILLTLFANQAIATNEQPATSSNSTQHLSKNECFMELKDNEEVIVTAAFHNGAGGFSQLQELLQRKPWGTALRSSIKKEIEKLTNEASPFLIMTLTKKQALVLEEHRDLIKWILVQSTTKPCANPQ